MDFIICLPIPFHKHDFMFILIHVYPIEVTPTYVRYKIK